MTDFELAKLVADSQKTLWIMCGLPYAGKTHLSRYLVAETGIDFVSIDDILSERGFDWNAGKLPDQLGWHEIFSTSYDRAAEALRLGRSVLYDSTNHTRESRDVLRRVAESVGAQSRVLFLNVPVATIWQRWEDNLRTPTRSVIARELVESTINSLEPPTEDEKIIRWP